MEVKMRNPSHTRRRILKGAALTPAIFTLHSGAANAAISNLRCLENRKSGEQPEKLFTLTKNSKWHTWTMKSGSVHVVKKVSVNEILNEFGETETQIVSSTGASAIVIVDYRYKGYRDAGGARYTRVNVAGNSLFKKGGYYYQVLKHRPAYTYVYVDDDGRVKGTGPDKKKYMAVTKSCWHSVSPNKA